MTGPTSEPASTDAIDAARGAAWALAAVASLLAAPGNDLATALAEDPHRRDVLAAAGWVDDRGRPGPALRGHFDDPTRDRLARALVSVLGQAARAAGGTTPTWVDQTDEVIVAQGEASAAGGQAIAVRVVPRYPAVAAALARGGSVLDVGTGIGALGTAIAEAFPAAQVVGIDVSERVLTIARARTAARPPDLADRLSFRRLDVADLDEPATHSVVWVPFPFLAEAVLEAALPRLVAALRPGGLLVAAATTAATDPVAAAAARWSTALAGGTGEGPDDVAARLHAAGLGEVTTTPSFPGGPALVAGLAPA